MRQIPAPAIHTLLLALILVTAAGLRSAYWLQIEHNLDHAYPIWQALQTLDHGALPLVGQGTSVLFANPALTGYLYLPVIALTRSALGAYILVIALNTLAVILAYRAVRGLLGRAAALAAAALMAVNPWVIEYSRSTWVQSLLPFFACATAWLLWPVLTGRCRRPGRRLLLALALLAAMTQTYLLAFVMLAPVGALLLVYWRRLPRRALAAGCVIFVVAFGLYGVGLLAQREGVEARLDEFAGRPARLSGEALSHALRLVSGKDYPAARGTDAPVDDAALRQSLTEAAHLGITGLVLAGAGLAAAGLAGRVRGKRDAGLILLMWFGLPVALMSYVGQPVHPFYQLLGLPAGYALAGWGAAALRRLLPCYGGALLLGLFVPFAMLMALNSARYYQSIYAAPGQFGIPIMPLDYNVQLGQAINRHLLPGAVIYADTDRPWMLDNFVGRSLHTYTRSNRLMVIPAGGALYITLAAPDAPAPWLPQATLLEAIPLRDGHTIRLSAPRALLVGNPLVRRSEQGLTLLGYDLAQMGDVHELVTYWRVDALTGDTGAWSFAPFAYVLDAAGVRVQVIEGEAVPGVMWGLGDVHIQRLAPDLPDEDFTIMIGQYDPARGENMVFLPDYTPLVEIAAGR